MGDPVYIYGAPPFPLGVIGYPLPFQFLAYTGVDPFNLNAHEGLGYLIKATPLDSAAYLKLPLPLPLGESDFRSPLQMSSLGVATTVYPAATVARSSAPTDTPANTWIAGKYGGGFNYGLSLFDGADPMSGGKGTIGVLQIEDPDGELDGLLSLAWDSAPITLLRGDPAAPFSTWSVVANLTAAGILYDHRKKEIRLRDLGWKLARDELHGLYYGGTGGADGDASLKGLIKPYGVGTVFNAPPVLITATDLIYQVSCSSIGAVTAVRDGGAPLGAGSDFGTYADLLAATVAPGTYATCLALGLIKTGAAPQLALTVDFRGDADTVDGYGPPATRAQIVRRIATGRGAMRLTGDDIDLASYTALEQRQSATLGYYWTAAISKADALSQVMAGCCGWWLVRPGGQLAFGQIDDPRTATPTFTLSYPASGAGEVRLGELAMIDYRVPRRGTFIGWSYNYLPQAVADLAGSVSQTLQAIYGQQSRFAGGDDLFIKNSFPSAQPVYVDGGFAFEADAAAEAERQQGLLRTRRERWQLRVIIDPLADVVGRVIRIANANRFGMGSARNLLCVGLSVSGDAEVTLDLWG